MYLLLLHVYWRTLLLVEFQLKRTSPKARALSFLAIKTSSFMRENLRYLRRNNHEKIIQLDKETDHLGSLVDHVPYQRDCIADLRMCDVWSPQHCDREIQRSEVEDLWMIHLKRGSPGERSVQGLFAFERKERKHGRI